VVHIHKSVHEREVLISEPLDSETVDVEPIPMNVFVETAPGIRTEGDVTVIPVLEEVLVTRKQLRLVEEVRITKRPSTRIFQENAILRSEEITVERHAPVSSNEAGEERPD
jgi:stress response protein YsnF